MTRVVLPVGLAALVVAGAFIFAYRSFGRPSGEDVGGLAAMRPVQDGLAQLPACGVRYRYHHRSPSDKVLLETCEKDSITGWVDVPKGWTFPSSGFVAERDRVGAPWRVFVDKERVSLDVLVAALTTLTPILANQGVAELARQRKSRDDYRSGAAERERAAKEAAAKNRSSYDSK